MSFIDWSDSEEMLELLVEYVADERGQAHGDPERRRFLAMLHSALGALQERFGTLVPAEATEALRAMRASIDAEFEDDPVIEHLEACVAELERISGVGAT